MFLHPALLNDFACDGNGTPHIFGQAILRMPAPLPDQGLVKSPAANTLPITPLTIIRQ